MIFLGHDCPDQLGRLPALTSSPIPELACRLTIFLFLILNIPAPFYSCNRKQEEKNKGFITPFPIQQYFFLFPVSFWKLSLFTKLCTQCCMITGWYANSGYKGLREIFGTTSWSKQGPWWDQITLLRSLFSSTLKTSMHGDCSASVSNLFHFLTVLKLKNVFPKKVFFLISSLFLFCSNLRTLPPFKYHCKEPGRAMRSSALSFSFSFFH